MMVPKRCSHSQIETSSSSHARDTGFVTQTEAQCAAAATTHSRVSKVTKDGFTPEDPGIFPAPLILPGDDLALDPKHPPQSLRQWAGLKKHQGDDLSRHTIYFAAAPSSAPNARFVQTWAKIQAETPDPAWKSAPPNMFDNVLKYLKVFYHGMPVTKYDGHLQFTNIEPPPKRATTSKSRSTRKRARSDSAGPSAIGLEFDIVGERYVMDIRARTSPHEKTPIYPKQLNLDDLLDAAIALLPTDAYALLLLVDHDIYEDEEDDFACGRAYGGSRVAVVSASRYNPALDKQVPGLDLEHVWPASHCKEYVKRVCKFSAPRKGLAKKKLPEPTVTLDSPVSPLRLAISAFQEAFAQHSGTNLSLSAQAGLWLSRVCKTASHELGHCAGIDHCVYYACIMQGTAGLAEDARQPPYLCPVDLEKLMRATGGDIRQRYERMAKLCEKDGFREEGMFHALRAWIDGVLGADEDKQAGAAGNRKVVGNKVESGAATGSGSVVIDPNILAKYEEEMSGGCTLSALPDDDDPDL